MDRQDDHDGQDDEDDTCAENENDEDDYHLAVSLHHRAQECLHSAFEAAFLIIINVSEEDIILRCYHQISS